MKISYFYLFNLSYASSIPSIIFENASPNHTWVLTNEYSQGAFCEFDSCHLELPPIFNTENDIRQDVAFSSNNITYNNTAIFSYDVCDSAGASAVIHPHGQTHYQCAEYSGGKITVTATPTNITAEAINNSVQAIHIKETLPRIYAIDVTLFPQVSNRTSLLFSNNPTSFPTVKPNYLRERDSIKNSVVILGAVLGTLGACFVLLCIRCCLNKHKSTIPCIKNNIHGLFTRTPEKNALIAMGHIAQNNYRENDNHVIAIGGSPLTERSL